MISMSLHPFISDNGIIVNDERYNKIEKKHIILKTKNTQNNCSDDGVTHIRQ